MLIPVVLSGGAGTRLWPLSRRLLPKPFIRLADGRSLLRRTLERAVAVAAGAPIYLVTHRDQYFVTRDECAELPNAPVARFLLEPLARNTAPAIALAALDIAARHGSDATMLILPADHLVNDLDGFARSVARAERWAQAGQLVTFGIPPTRPETGFGYIALGEALDGATARIAAFVEKPDRATAAAFLASGRHLWNSGMFCFRVGTLLAALARHSPALLEAARAVYASADPEREPLEFAAAAFAGLPEISIDYALMEKAEQRAVVPAEFDWSDIGSWKALGELEPADAAGNRIEGEAVLIDSRDCFVRSERLLAVVGVEGLVVVDSGDAVLVANRERAQDVKHVVDELRRRRHEAVEVHRTVQRPWGSYTVLEDAADCKVKRLVIKPGGAISLQLHHRRSEHWTVVQGVAHVTLGERSFDLHPNQSVQIPAGTRHRLENRSSAPVALIEVQCGDYFGEDDIVRFDDRYGRVPA